MSELSANASIRPPAVAGLFYPRDEYALRATISDLLAANGEPAASDRLKACVVPHAGFQYSGPVAAAIYSHIQPLRRRIKHVVLVGPSHRVYLRGIAVPQADSFATPLGEIDIDTTSRNRLLQAGLVIASDAPHASEHCIEVQLPFLQTVLEDFDILPMVVGDATPDHVARALTAAWGGSETLVLISSDLSHYHDYEDAREIDSITANAIERRTADLTHEQACGATGINGLLLLAKQRGMDVFEIARNNSGDTAGDRDRVVGYGGFAVYEP